MLSQIVEMVAKAQRSRAPIQKYADHVSGLLVPAVIAIAVLAFIGWAVWGPEPALSYGLVAAVAVLIIACPCALGLATPMSIMTATGRGAPAGVLIKNAEALERFEKIDILIVDKTGTLTVHGSAHQPDVRGLRHERLIHLGRAERAATAGRADLIGRQSRAERSGNRPAAWGLERVAFNRNQNSPQEPGEF